MSLDAFSVQSEVRASWRTYLDKLQPLRPALYQHCLVLTGSLWDAEDLAQDSLMRVFSLLGKIDADLTEPKAYLLRTATNLWIDQTRRQFRDLAFRLESTQSTPTSVTADQAADLVDAEIAAKRLLQTLHPQERAALVLKDVLGHSLSEVADVLETSVGAVKSALHRARSRLDEKVAPASFGAPSREIVERFMQALSDQNLVVLREICATDLQLELVGGAQTNSFDEGQNFFAHAHFVMPELGFGTNPWWELVQVGAEFVVVGYRTLNQVEGINEIHRLDIVNGKVQRDRCYCFCPDVLAALADIRGGTALARPYRSPS